MSQIEIYKAGNGEIQIEVHFEQESVWLTQKQMADLFGRSRVTITEHISRVFKEKELEEDSVCRNFRHTAEDGKNYKAQYYNLDVIISVGYRVKSKRGTQFRQWATQRLKDYLVKGYTINQKRLEQLQQVVNIIHQSGETKNLSVLETKGLLDIITNYTQSFILLNQFDSNSLLEENLDENISYEIEYNDALNAIEELKRQLIKNKEASKFFGNQKDKSFSGILKSIVQTFDGKYLYPSIESRLHTCCIL